MAEQTSSQAGASLQAEPGSSGGAAAVDAVSLSGGSADGAPSSQLQAEPFEPSVSEPSAESVASPGDESVESGPSALERDRSGSGVPSATDSDDTDIEKSPAAVVPQWRDFYVFEHRPEPEPADVPAPAAAEAVPAPVPEPDAERDDLGDGEPDGVVPDAAAAADAPHGDAGREGEERQQRQPQFRARGVISESPGYAGSVPEGVAAIAAMQPRHVRPHQRLPPIPRWADRLERMTLNELRERASRTSHLVHCSLEELAAYQVRPDENLEEAIHAHGKVCLDPRYDYVVSRPLLLPQWCYVIGNGARIRVRTTARLGGAIKAGHYRDAFPEYIMVQGVTRCTFVDCVFVDEPPEGQHQRPIIRGQGGIYVIDCCFYDCRSAAVMADVKGEVKGCNFYNCHTGVLYTGNLIFEVAECAFERCVIGVKSPNSPLKMTYCCARDCVCLVLMGGSGTLRGNVFMHGPDLRDGSVVTCAGGSIQLLSAYHIVARRRTSYPVFVRNHCNEGTIYVGHRRGNLYTRRCHFAATQMLLDLGCAQKVNCSGSYVNSLGVMRVTAPTNETSAQRECRCECGRTHMYVYSMVVEARDAVILPNPRSYPVENLEFCSDSDE